MKKLFFFLFAGSILAACNNDSKVKGMNDSTGGNNKMEPSTGNAKLERNKQNVMAMYDAMKKGDVNAFMNLCSSDVKDYGDGSMKPMNRDSLQAFMQSWSKAFPDFSISDEKVLADGDWVAVYAENSGTWKGDFMGQKANGKKFKFYDADIFKLNDEGKITEHHNVQPVTTIAQQLGMKMQ